MNPESENFEQLRRLLALKRHEQPPPGYFNNFSGEVVARIRRGEHRSRGIEHALEEHPWLQRLLAAFDTKPIFAGAFGAAVCGLLVLGIVSSESGGSAPVMGSAITASSASADATPLLAGNQTAGNVQLVSSSSTNPVAPSLNSLFDQFQMKAQPAAFNLSGGN